MFIMSIMRTFAVLGRAQWRNVEDAANARPGPGLCAHETSNVDLLLQESKTIFNEKIMLLYE